MPKDIDDLYKKLDQYEKSHQKDSDNLNKSVSGVAKDNDKILKEINDVKKEVKDIAFKVDLMLEILNNFSIMIAEDDEDLEENYEIEDSDESWVPKEDEFWEDEEQ